VKLARHIADLIAAVTPTDERRRTRFVRPALTFDDLQALTAEGVRGEKLIATKDATKAAARARDRYAERERLRVAALKRRRREAQA
jgi:hypothetical protein